MKLEAKARLQESLTDGGAAFEELDEAAFDSAPEVQDLTNNDGSIDKPIEQALLNDDLPIAR